MALPGVIPARYRPHATGVLTNLPGDALRCHFPQVHTVVAVAGAAEIAARRMPAATHRRHVIHAVATQPPAKCGTENTLTTANLHACALYILHNVACPHCVHEMVTVVSGCHQPSAARTHDDVENIKTNPGEGGMPHSTTTHQRSTTVLAYPHLTHRKRAARHRTKQTPTTSGQFLREKAGKAKHAPYSVLM
jgi:hypothetical protein